MKFFRFLFIVGWFFAFSSPHETYKKATETTLVGPFDTREICQSEADALKDFIEMLGVPGIKWKSCFEMEGA